MGVRFYPAFLLNQPATISWLWAEDIRLQGWRLCHQLNYSWHIKKHVPLSHSPSSQGRVMSPMGGEHTVGLYHYAQLGNPQSYKRLLANLPKLCPGQRHYLYYSGQEKNLLCVQNGTLFLHFKVVYYTNILENSSRTKAIIAYANKTYQNAKEPWKIVTKKL